MTLEKTFAKVLRLLTRRRLLARWSEGFVDDTWMHDRARAAASWIDESSRVLDLGSGKRILDLYLPPGCTYVGVDLDGVHPDNIVIDLDTSFDLPKDYDVAVLLGVVEFLKRPLRTLERLKHPPSLMILSYVCRKGTLADSLETRQRAGARNHWNQEELLSHLRGIGLVVEKQYVFSDRPTDRHLMVSLRWQRPATA